MEKKKSLYLPFELVIQILVRLPVKSLIRFKCVSKSWSTLISDPDFANSHFQLTAPAHTRRILSISTYSLEIQSIDFESSVNHEYTSVTLNLNSLPPFSLPLEIKGSCRGFLFLHHYSKFYLWNPSTGFHRQIPTSPLHSRFNVRDYSFPCVYGFGYDQSRDDYLLVLLSSKTRHDLSSYLEFFSLRNNTWKQIKGTHFPYGSHDPEPGTLFNGAIYWLDFRSNLMTNGIVVFDLMERKLLEMNLLNDLQHAIEYCYLWVFGDILSIRVLSYANHTLEIWVMKEHSSWIKTLVFRIIDNGIPTFYPMYSTTRGDIIGTNFGYGLVRCNDKGQFLVYRSFYNINPHKCEVAMYTESLLSLPDNREQI